MKKFLICITIISISFSLDAQDTNYVDPDYKSEKQKKPKQRRDMQDRVYFGGTLGLQFGYATSILVEPMVGFKMTEKLSTGVGLGLRYGSYRDPDFTFTNYLGRFFARYIIIPKIYAHAEYVMESYDSSWGDINWSNAEFNRGSRTTVPYLFVGGGLRQPSGNGSLVIQVLFNVLQNDKNSQVMYPAGTPYITIGYFGGF